MTLINKMTYAPLLGSLGIDAVVSPRAITVSTILQHVRRGRIRSVHTLADGFAEIIEADALETSRLVGVPLREARFPAGIVVGAIIRDDEVITPRGDTVKPSAAQSVAALSRLPTMITAWSRPWTWVKLIPGGRLSS